MRKLLERLRLNSFLKDSAILQFSGGLTALSSLVSVLVLVKVLGAELQGEYITALSLYGLFFMLFNTGVMQATVTQLAANMAQNRPEKIAAWLAFLVKGYAIAGVFLLIVGYFALPRLGDLVAHDRQVGVMAWWLCASPLLELPRVVAAATFQAGRRMKDLALLELTTELGRVIFVCSGAVISGDARGPVIGTIAAAGLGSIVRIVLYRRVARDVDIKLPSPRGILSQVREVPLRQGLRLSIRIGFLRSIDALAFNILPVLFIQTAGRQAGNLRTDEWVAYFRVAQRVMQIPVVALQGISRTALPALSQIAGRKDMQEFSRTFKRVTLGSGALTIVGVLAALVLLPYGVKFIPDESYQEPVLHLCRILAVGYGIVGFSVAFDSFYIVTDQLRIALRVTALASFISFPALYLLCLYLPGTGAACLTMEPRSAGPGSRAQLGRGRVMLTAGGPRARVLGPLE